MRHQANRRILCVWLLQWPIARWLAEHDGGEWGANAECGMRNAEGREPESGLQSAIRNPKSQIRNPQVPPLVLFEFVRNARRVSACSSAACALGVRRGMPVAEAAALAGENRLLLREHDRAADLRYLRRLAEWCEQFSPLVGWQETDAWRPADSPDSLLLDVTGLERLFGGEGALARGVTRAFRRRGFPVRVAVADTIGGAWAMAHYGPWRKERRAPLIVDKHAECQPTVSSADATDWHSAFAHLPLAALRIPGQTIDLLAALGLSTVAEVAALPRQQLSARFGGGLLTRLDQLHGIAEERIAAHRAPPAFVAEAVLNHPTHRPETIEAIIEQLLAQACRQLARRRRGALQLEVRLYAMRHVLARLSVGLYRASAAVSHLLDLMRLQLEQIHLPDLVTDVALEVTATGKLELRQRALFSHGEETRLARADDGRRLAELVDRLSSRLGALAVVQPRLLRDAQPEFACRWLPLTGDAAERLVGASKQPPTPPKKTAGSPRKAASADAVWARRDIPPRPLWLLSRPEPLAVTLATAAVGAAGPPLAFRYQGRRHQVTASWGPERIETGWWRGGMVRRDYYRVETTAGLRFWLFRRSDGAWFLHGEFD